MEESYDKLYRVDKHGFRNTTFWRKYAFIDIFASSVLEIQRDQEFIGVVDEFLSFEEARVACKKCREYHCTPFGDAAIMPLFRIDAVIREAVDSFKSRTDMQNMCRMEIVKGHESEVGGHLRPPKSGLPERGVRSLCNLPSGLRIDYQSLQQIL